MVYCVSFSFYSFFFFLNDTATTEIYTSIELFPYTTLFRPPGGRAHPRRRANAFVARSSQRSEEHTSELQSPIDISYAVFCLKKKKTHNKNKTETTSQLPKQKKYKTQRR